MKGFTAILALLIIISASCKKSNNDSKAPEISFVGLEPNTVRSGSSEDNVFLNFRIADANGDLGLPQTHTSADSFDIYMIDSRSLTDTSQLITDTVKLYFPEIPKQAVNPNKELEGFFTIKIMAAEYLHSRDDSLRTRDTLHFKVFVKDKALNISNQVTTSDIYIEQL